MREMAGIKAENMEMVKLLAAQLAEVGRASRVLCALLRVVLCQLRLPCKQKIVCVSHIVVKRLLMGPGYY
jgi:hypothetical protein